MIQVYICTVIMNIFLFLLAKTYTINNTNNFMDKVYLFKSFDNDDSPLNPIKGMVYMLFPIINFITTLTLSFILFSEYSKYEKFVNWMFSEVKNGEENDI